MDDTVVNDARVSIGAGAYGVIHISLKKQSFPVMHTLQSDQPFGVQVISYDLGISYASPGGLNLGALAP